MAAGRRIKTNHRKVQGTVTKQMILLISHDSADISKHSPALPRFSATKRRCPNFQFGLNFRGNHMKA